MKAGADVVVLDGMQGGTAATQDVFIEHVGLPILAAIRPAVQALQDLGQHRKIQLIVSGGIRSGADVAKALALGADAVAIGTAALIALGDNGAGMGRRVSGARHQPPAPYDDWHEGRDPAGITTQDPVLAARLDPVRGGRRLANYLAVLTLEAQAIARACGKSHLHNLEPEDLVALTIESRRDGAGAAGRDKLGARQNRRLLMEENQPPRHCERSEAIQSREIRNGLRGARLSCFATPAMTVPCGVPARRHARAAEESKVFWFFFLKKNCFPFSGFFHAV